MNLFLKSVRRCVTSLSLIGFLKTERRLIYRTIISCLRSFCSISVQRNYRKRLPTVPKTGKQEYFKFAFDLSVAFLCKGITENAFQQSQKQENKSTSNLSSIFLYHFCAKELQKMPSNSPKNRKTRLLNQIK